MVDGTTTGTTTDLDGVFTIAAEENVPVTVSCIGYKNVSTTLKDGMTVVMEIESTLLEDVVVVAYGVQKKETLTGAISVGKDEMLQEKGALSSPLQAMRGQIPGVIITRQSSAPGDENWSMSLRGAVSANSSEPLVIIDGVAYGSINDMRLLNPSDIESMSFLKDGAAAIYGSRAAGGVGLITTKKGKSGRAKVEYSGSYTLKSVSRMPGSVFHTERSATRTESPTMTGYSCTTPTRLTEPFSEGHFYLQRRLFQWPSPARRKMACSLSLRY